ncbi:hypothetical protein D6C78_08569 [Aureobasidium pullulans]|uniref:Uncharacterized protein n=1 Tax=Aureobasidium pullulans TaxID=5580 RepID=A0A4T0BIV1_AURPU|nr:hypothetical protein D6C78_08569 [Aureobasidium pullulans]
MSDANPNLVQDSEISGPINVVLEDKIKRLTGDVERLTALAKNDSNTIKLQQVRIRYLMKKIAKMKGATKIREEILVLEERLEAGRKKNEDELLALQKQRDAVDQKTKGKIQTWETQYRKVDYELFNREEELRMVEEDEEEE